MANAISRMVLLHTMDRRTGIDAHRLRNALGPLSLLILLGLTSLAQASGFASVNWDSVLGPDQDTHIQFGVEIQGSDPFSKNGDQVFAPASNTKLLTSAAALAKLGPDFKFETKINYEKISSSVITNLTLTGSGDPSWGLSELGENLTTRVDQMANALYAAGVREIQGPLQIKASDVRWSQLSYPQGWQTDDHVECYGALAQEFNLNINCSNYLLAGVGHGHWSDYGVDVPVSNELTQGDSTHVSIVPRDFSNPRSGFAIRGTWRAGTPPQAYTLPVHQVSHWVKALLMRSLVAKGIRLTQAGSEIGTPAELKFYSPPLSLIIKPFMKNSIDMIGDDLYKVLGERFGNSSNENLNQAGKQVMSEFETGIDESLASAIIYDGSGVSRENKITPRALLHLLEWLKNRSDFDFIWNSLPIAGVDGTLVHRMKGTAAQGVLRAKTGTLNGVYNLSGYVPVTHGGAISDYVPFVILTNTQTTYASSARSAEDRIGATLAKLVNTFREFALPWNELTTPYVPEHAGLDRAD